jgi:hypothetical protein
MLKRPDSALAGDDPEKLICRDVFWPHCCRPDPGFRTCRKTEPWWLAPKLGTTKKKGGRSK